MKWNLEGSLNFGATWVGSKAALELITLQNGMSDNNKLFLIKLIFLVESTVEFIFIVFSTG